MRQIFVAFYLTISLFISGHAGAATEPKILQLQSQLAELSEKREKLNQSYHDELAENANAMKEKEQSTANKTLGAASMGAMGIGGMMVASSLAEQNANADAERDMTAYLATFRCDYGAGMNIQGGETGIELPGAAELIPLYAEYVSLANDLKTRKEQLGMKPGIESEPILDSATTGLYDDVSTGITSGAYASLARAMQNPDGEDAKKWSESQDEIAKKLKTGAITAGAGAVVGVVGDMIVNKDAPKERSAEIKTEYESNLNNLEQEIATTQSELDAAIAANAKLVDEYNNLLQQHMDFIATMVHEDCKSEQSEYIEAIKALSPITDNTTDMSDMKIPYDLAQQQEIYRLCIQRYETLAMALADIEAQTDADIAALDDEIEIEDFTIAPFDTTIDIAPIQINGNDNKDNTAGDNDNNNGENNAIADNQCPDENPRLSTLNSSHHVGDSCTYGNVTVGYVQKYKSGKYAGTCTCVATACKTGYVVEKGVCKEKTANQSDDNTPPVALQMPEIKFYDVCKDDRGKSGGTEYCIDKPFNWTDVQMLQATALATEYAYVQNGHTVRCENDENKIRKSGNDDYISCTSTDNKHFYEFKFNDVAESIDSDIQLNIINALCKGVYSGTIPRKDSLGQHLCKIPDKFKHAALKESASKFNIQSNISSEGVWLTQPGVNDTYTTKKIDGIDPFAFYSGDIQIRANGVMIDGLYEYAALQLAPREIKTFTCKSNPFQVSKTIDGRRVKGTTDDVLKCYVNGTAVDFVFDDMSELSKKLSRGGYSNMNCTVAGGAYNGYDCMYVGKTQCERIRKLSAATMPANKLPFWNANTQECELPAAADATEYQQNINMGIMVGGVIVGVVITVATGGIGAPAALAMLAVETAGGVMEIAATQKIYDAIEEFIKNSKKCNDAICAEAMLRDNLQRMADMTFDITDAQMNGIDRELERLANLIPTDSEFYQSLASQGTSLDANNKGIKHWQPEQIWRAVGIAMQLASVITSIGKWAFGKANKLPHVTTAIANRADDAIRMTASQAKRLDEIDARLIRIQSELDANPSASRAADLRAERTRLTQEKNTILNKVGTKNADDINNAKAAARSADEIATAQRELDDARAALRKRLDWESKNPGAAKNDLQSKNSNGRKLRNDVRAAEQKLRDMGESVTPMEFTDPDDIVRGASRASDDASDASRGTDNSAPENNAGARNADDINARTALRDKAKDPTRGLTTDDIVQDGKLNEELLDDLIQEGGPVYIDRTNLDSTHIRSLNKKFQDAGFEIDNGNGGTVFGFKKSASNADDVARAANSATDADDTVRPANVADNVDEITRATTSRTIFGDINISPADRNIIETAISKKHAGTLSRAEHIKAIRTMDKYFNEPATRNFASQMRRNLMDVFRNDINKTSELIEGLYNGNGISFVEFILDNLGPKYGIPRGTIRIQAGVFDQPGYALYANKNFYLNTAHPHNAEEIINLVIHEFTHAIDDLSPQNGVIGKTLNAWGDNANLYVRHGELMDGTQDMYKLIPTERSAHLVGDIVSGTTEYGTAPMANTTNLAHEIANLL